MRKVNTFLLLLLASVMILSGCAQTADSERNITCDESDILEITVDGNIYYFDGLNFTVDYDEETDEVSYNSSQTELPESYVEYAAISSISSDEPTEDCQIKLSDGASKSANISGTVYTSLETPDAVYVYIADGMDAAPCYVRFTDDILRETGLIFYQGELFSLSALLEDTISELPEECDLIGTLVFVGQDAIPSQNLETNVMTDAFNKPLNGREAYYDPENATLYVSGIKYSQNEPYEIYYICTCCS